jgi:hypothetical protein
MRHHHRRSCGSFEKHSTHSTHTPNARAARCWSHRAFGPHWRQGYCIAYTESRDELSPPVNGSSWGPWQILKTRTIHTWLNVWKVTHSWSYAAYATHRVAWHPPKNGRRGYYDLSPWHPDCGA